MCTYYYYYLKNLKIFLWKKWRFRLRWDSSPGYYIRHSTDGRNKNFQKFQISRSDRVQNDSVWNSQECTNWDGLNFLFEMARNRYKKDFRITRNIMKAHGKWNSFRNMNQLNTFLCETKIEIGFILNFLYEYYLDRD